MPQISFHHCCLTQYYDLQDGLLVLLMISHNEQLLKSTKIFLTYLMKILMNKISQLIRVKFTWSLISEPPQKKLESLNPACHGQLFGTTTVPPTIFKPDSSGLIFWIPHAEKNNFKTYCKSSDYSAVRVVTGPARSGPVWFPSYLGQYKYPGHI